jgi:aconitate hydratase
VADIIQAQDLVTVAVLSGNRNFEGRIHPQVRASYLASPPLVVAFALAGTVNIDLTREPIGADRTGAPVMLADLWPSDAEVRATVAAALSPEMFAQRYRDVFRGDETWAALPVPESEVYRWDDASTYVRRPPFLEHLPQTPEPRGDIHEARVLAWLGESVTTDHISPAGAISPDTPAARYLVGHGVAPADFNTYGSRRGNHEVMMRGTFANVRLRNRLAGSLEGGWTTHLPSGEVMSIYDAAMRYQAERTPLIVIAGAEYGSGSSRDWAAKGPMLLGVRAVIAQSFERIHRSNLVGLGVLPLQLLGTDTPDTLGLDGTETFDVAGISGGLVPGQRLRVTARRADGTARAFEVTARLDTPVDVEYYRHGGVLPFVVRKLVAKDPD